MKLTRAVTHIRLCDANDAKITTLDTLAAEYQALCQQYVTHFCVEAEPNGYAAPCFPSLLSQRWQRVAIQQAASNRPEQQTFCCGVCGWQAHADHNAAVNIAARRGDREIQASKTRQELKALLDARHQRWREETGWS